MDRLGLYHGVPGKRHLEITSFYNSEQASEPRGLSVSKLCECAEGNEVTVKGPEGDTYKFSLAPWAQDDAEQTFLLMNFRFTPAYPVRIDPPLLTVASLPSSLPQRPAPLSSVAIPGPGAELCARPSSENRLEAFFSAGMMQSHRIMLRAGDPIAGIAASQLLALPELLGEADVPCPLCDGTIHISETWEQFVNRAATSFGGEQAILEVIVIHPSDQAETKTPPVNYPFSIQRYWEFTPISTPTLPDPDPHGVERYVAIRSHNHFITLQTASSRTSAASLLSLPESKQEDIVCPLCDITLHSREPLEKAIKLLSDNAQGDTTCIEVRISHPRNMPETKTPSADYPFQVLQHEKPLDSEMQHNLPESSPIFVVKPKEAL